MINNEVTLRSCSRKFNSKHAFVLLPLDSIVQGDMPFLKQVK